MLTNIKIDQLYMENFEKSLFFLEIFLGGTAEPAKIKS